MNTMVVIKGMAFLPFVIIQIAIRKLTGEWGTPVVATLWNIAGCSFAVSISPIIGMKKKTLGLILFVSVALLRKARLILSPIWQNGLNGSLQMNLGNHGVMITPNLFLQCGKIWRKRKTPLASKADRRIEDSPLTEKTTTQIKKERKAQSEKRKAEAKAKRIRDLRKAPKTKDVDALRTKSGRKSRSKAETERAGLAAMKKTRETVVSARVQHQGISEKEAVDPMYGFALGRLFKGRVITKREYDAGLRYSEDSAKYYGLNGIPFPSARAQNMFAVAGYAGETTESQARAARAASNEFMACDGLLASQGQHGVQVRSTVKSVCIEDLGDVDWPSNMKAWLKVGLLALADRYGQ